MSESFEEVSAKGTIEVFFKAPRAVKQPAELSARSSSSSSSSEPSEVSESSSASGTKPPKKKQKNVHNPVVIAREIPVNSAENKAVAYSSRISAPRQPKSVPTPDAERKRKKNKNKEKALLERSNSSRSDKHKLTPSYFTTGLDLPSKLIFKDQFLSSTWKGA